MIISVTRQLNLVLFSILAGMLTGILFDIYRVIRGFENPNKFVTFIEDILFWIFAAIAVFVFLMYTNEALLTIYVYTYIVIGIWIYIKILSHVFIKVQYITIKNLVKVIRIIRNTLIYPFEYAIYKFKTKNKRK